MNLEATKQKINEALIIFQDFIYAVVFVAIIQKLFDDINDQPNVFTFIRMAQLSLLAATFYFLAWDWILGRALTLRNPYKGYTSFFYEILIAAFAYGLANAVMKGKLIFLIHFAFIMLLGGLWARRMEEQCSDRRDLIEFCMIQTLQFIGAGISLVLYMWSNAHIGITISSSLTVVVIIGGWSFILVYEMLTPRYRGIVAGPGVPFVARSDVRRIRRFLSHKLREISKIEE